MMDQLGALKPGAENIYSKKIILASRTSNFRRDLQHRIFLLHSGQTFWPTTFRQDASQV